jgi:hypothetical protein
VLRELPTEGWPAEDGGLQLSERGAKGEGSLEGGGGTAAVDAAAGCCGCGPLQPSSSSSSSELWLRGVPPSSVARALSPPPPGRRPARSRLPASPALQGRK